MALSPREKDLLINRPENSRDRANNDLKIRRKLAGWLDDLPDAALIIDLLPEKQLVKEVATSQALDFMIIAEKILSVTDFGSIVGDISQPDGWKVVTDDGKERPATDEDIVCHVLLSNFLARLKNFTGGPASDAVMLSRLDDDPNFHNRVTDAERAGIKRVKEAFEHIREKENES